MTDHITTPVDQAALDEKLARYKALQDELQRNQDEMTRLNAEMMADQVLAAINQHAVTMAHSPRAAAIITFPVTGNKRPVFMIEADRVVGDSVLFVKKPLEPADWHNYKNWKTKQTERRYGYWEYGAEFSIAKDGRLQVDKHAAFISVKAPEGAVTAEVAGGPDEG